MEKLQVVLKLDLLDEKFCQGFLRNAILKFGSFFLILAMEVHHSSRMLYLSGKVTIELNKDSNRDDNLLFAEGGSRIIFQ